MAFFRFLTFPQFNPHWHELWKQKKCSSLAPHEGIFSKDSMSFAGRQINPIDVNFHIQKSLQFFYKNSVDKIWSKKDMEIKVSPLMLIRVKLRSASVPSVSKKLTCCGSYYSRCESIDARKTCRRDGRRQIRTSVTELGGQIGRGGSTGGCY